MFDSEFRHSPAIIFRPICPSDLQVLEQIHALLFPIRYEREFFLNVVNGKGIISWGAVDLNRTDGCADELIGFVTTRLITTKECEIDDLLSYDASRNDRTLMYILTLGVVERYRNLGTASSLIGEVIKYASSISSCRAVYLHVIAYNQPAICFYQKMQFRVVRRLPNFYFINGQHYDSFLFLYYVNGGRSPCSPVDAVTAFVAYFRGLLRMLAAKLWKSGGHRNSRWPRHRESHSLGHTQNKKVLNTENAICQTV